MNDQNNASDFWETGPGLTIRWVAFIPMGFILTGILSFISRFVFVWLGEQSAEGMSPLVVIIVLAVVGIPAFILYAAFMLTSVVSACTQVAPKPKIAAIIYGMAVIANLAYGLSLEGEMTTTETVLGFVDHGFIFLALFSVMKKEML